MSNHRCIALVACVGGVHSPVPPFKERVAVEAAVASKLSGPCCPCACQMHTQLDEMHVSVIICTIIMSNGIIIYFMQSCMCRVYTLSMHVLLLYLHATHTSRSI